MRKAGALFLMLFLSGEVGCSMDPSLAEEPMPTASPSPLPAPPASPPWYALVEARPAEKLDEWRDIGGWTPSLPRPATREDALKYLLETTTFSDPTAGFGNETTGATFAFAALLAQPDAAAAFGELLKRGRIAGQLYALCGLYLTDRPNFDRHMPRFLHRDGKVERFQGCLLMMRPLREVTAEIASGFWPTILGAAARELQAKP